MDLLLPWALGEQEGEQSGQLDQGERVPLENFEPIMFIHGQEAASGDLEQEVTSRSGRTDLTEESRSGDPPDPLDGGKVTGQSGQVAGGTEDCLVGYHLGGQYWPGVGARLTECRE